MKLNKNILPTILLGGLLIGLSLLSHAGANRKNPHNTKPISKDSRLLYRMLFPRSRKGNLFCWGWNLRHGTDSSQRQIRRASLQTRSIRKQRHQRRTKIQRSM